MILVICSLYNFFGFFIGWLSLRTLLANFRLGSPARSSETFRAVFCATGLKFHPKISLAAVADTAPRLALRENSLNSPRSLGA